jgi:hypothetical protein
MIPENANGEGSEENAYVCICGGGGGGIKSFLK